MRSRRGEAAAFILRRDERLRRLERFPTEWNHSIDKKSLNLKALEHVLGGRSPP
jgi:hypothetical protein